MSGFGRRAPGLIGGALLASACTLVGTAPPRATAPLPPAAPSGTAPDAVPRVELPASTGNMREYEQGGRWYQVLDSSEGYDERGIASWYGEDFHGRLTSSGEPYDMHAMTAAHRTLPIPTYVRVTNQANGASVIVRVNDRGPFSDPGRRIIDVSYAAALRLGLVRDGTATVRVEALQPWQVRTRR